MRIIFLLGLVILSLLLTTGCAPPPQNADEFRKMAPGAFMGKTEKFDVDRPFKKVANSYKKMAPKCLDKRITSSTTRYDRYGGHTSTIVTDYKPTVIVKKNRAEVHVQQHFVSGVVDVNKEPPGGYYMLVADAVPAGKNKTNVTIYSASVYKKLMAAIKNWSTGKEMCPDLTQ